MITDITTIANVDRIWVGTLVNDGEADTLMLRFDRADESSIVVELTLEQESKLLDLVRAQQAERAKA